MVAPDGEPRSDSTPGSVGRETAGQIAPSRGSTSTAYKMAGAALTQGDRMIRAVHCQRGRRIIKAQIGRTSRLLARKSCSIYPLTDVYGFNREPAGRCPHPRTPPVVYLPRAFVLCMLRVS